MSNFFFLMLYLEYDTLKVNFTKKKTKPDLKWKIFFLCNTPVSLGISLSPDWW